uniref:Endopeptidase Clp n=1 Tax=Lobochlamys segnis TaxID=52035 RepID=A0A0S2IC34_9CHLO|nr:proteolytic subunit 2 of clp protease [Lobochlamys segnis]
MPIGVPRIIYCWGEELPAQWTDIYNFIFRRRMIFLMQYLDDELCNQICGLLINIHMEDRSKELEKKEMEKSGLFKSSTKSGTTNASESGGGSATKNFGNTFQQKERSERSGMISAAKGKKSIEDLLISEEDLAIDENSTLEQYTLQKITMDWLNWNANFFDYADEPYLFYLAEILSKDFTQQNTNLLYTTEMSRFMKVFKTMAFNNSNEVSLLPEATLSNEKPVSLIKEGKAKEEKNEPNVGNSTLAGANKSNSSFLKKTELELTVLKNKEFDFSKAATPQHPKAQSYEQKQDNQKTIDEQSLLSYGDVYSPFRFLANFQLEFPNLKNQLFRKSLSMGEAQNRSGTGSFVATKLVQQLKQLQKYSTHQNFFSSFPHPKGLGEATQGNKSSQETVKLNAEILALSMEKEFSFKLKKQKNQMTSVEKIYSQRTLKTRYKQDKNGLAFAKTQSTNLFLNKRNPTDTELDLAYQKWKTKNNFFSGPSFSKLNTGSMQNKLASSRTGGLVKPAGVRGATLGNEISNSRDFYRKQTERLLQEEESKKVFVIINSFGGSVGNGITVHDALQFIKAGSLTLALGVAASAASLVLAGGTIGERYVTEGCHSMIHQPECLTPDHEVLTDKGWLPIPLVTLEHKVAVLNLAGELEYQHPIKLHKSLHEGQMYKVKNSDVDLLVTLNHRMLVATTNLDQPNLKYCFKEAREIKGQTVRYKKTASWEKEAYQVVIPAYGDGSLGGQSPEKKPPMESFLCLLGLWLSIGHINLDKLIITHKKPEIHKLIEKTLDELGYDYSTNSIHDESIEKTKEAAVGDTIQYYFGDFQLVEFFKAFNFNSKNKRLPSFVWELNKEQCNVLLDSLLLGAKGFPFGKRSSLAKARKAREAGEAYNTFSLEFARDISRLILHCGYAASITLNIPLGSDALTKQPYNPCFPHRKGEGSSLYGEGSSLLTPAKPVARTIKVSASLREGRGEALAGAASSLGTAEQDDKDLRKTEINSNSENGSSMYWVNIISEEEKTQPYANSPKRNEKFDDSFVEYSGDIYCLTVPYGIFYVQRNGYPVWTGNSSLQGQASDIWIDSAEVMKIRKDVAEIYSLSTYRPRHKILRDLDRDFYLTATEAVYYGLADEIATNEVMHEIIDMTNKVWDYHDSKQQRLLESRESANSGLDIQTQS